MNSEELKKRTKQFALDTIRFVDTLPREQSCFIVGKQFLRAATSVGANYRAACKARSKADFISKITIVEEEADECQYWIELLQQSGKCDPSISGVLLSEAKELTAIFTATGKTAKQRK